MVQVHGTFTTSVPLMFAEAGRQPLKKLDDVVTAVTGSNIYVKWDTRYLVRYN
jgi:hypothetical protein